MKIVFLDRDGVINTFPGNGKYVTRVKDFHFIRGSLDAIVKLTQLGYTIFVISNQAGVGKGVFTKHKLDRITTKMLVAVEKAGGKIHSVYYSTTRSEENCIFRKPNIGSVLKALASIKKDKRILKNAFFVGDTEIDIQCGKNAGCKTIFALSGREDMKYLKRKWKIRPDFVVPNLLAASKIILGKT